MIFRNRSRHDSSAKLSGESSYGFLDRSARDEIEAVRAMLESLILKYPEEETPEMLSRLQSENDEHFNSAFFELIVYSMLSRLGYRMQPHPVLENGSSKRPDFLVTAPCGQKFYVEAVLASEENGNLKGQHRMVQTTLDAIRKARHDKFRVDVHYSGLPRTQPATRKLIADILAWLDTLDPDEVRIQAKTTTRVYRKSFSWSHEDFRLLLTPRPINRVKSKSLIGIASRGMAFSNSAKPLRDAITFKGSRYGELEFPLLIAVNFSTPFLDSDDELEALFGLPLTQFTTNSLIAAQKRSHEGAWIGRKGPKYTRVSGVWIFRGLSPYSLASRESTLYLNPWASKPLPASLKCFPHTEVIDEAVTYGKGISLREIFELSAEWPDKFN